MQTVLLHGPVGQHIDIVDVFKDFLHFDSGNENHERFITSLLKSSIFWDEIFKYHVNTYTKFKHFVDMITPTVLLRNGLMVTENFIDFCEF